MSKPKSPCAICGTFSKNSRFWLCRECSIEWGCYEVPYRDWPEWVRELVKGAQKTYRREERGTVVEISVDPTILEKYLSTDVDATGILRIIIAHQQNKTFKEPTYYETSTWFTKRRKALDRDGYTCQDCKSQNRLEVHHLTYDRFRNENLDDLITLCHKCHGARHGF